MTTENTPYILIVEDARDIQLLLARLFHGLGYRVECANDGQKAIDFLKSVQALPSLILLDLMMPNMDGYQFKQAQAGLSRIADIPVVLMTADSDIKTKAAKIGAQGFLKKPFLSIDDLIGTIDNFL